MEPEDNLDVQRTRTSSSSGSHGVRVSDESDDRHVKAAGEAAKLRQRRRKVIAVCGSTGTGKSQLGVEIAHHLASSLHDNGSSSVVAAEIISADSMQLYRGLDVITNKASIEEMGNIPHHMISVLDPTRDQEYNVGTFVEQANRLVSKHL